VKKIIAVSAVVATMLVGAGSANACSDLGYLNVAMKAGKQAERGLASGQRNNYGAAATQLSQARTTLLRAPVPCSSKYKRVDYQYSKSFEYFERAMVFALSGEYRGATAAMKQGNLWLNRASATLG
jgi:hypothetical protein